MPALWVIGARNAVQLLGLEDAITHEKIPDATVTAQLLDPDADDAPVSGSSFSLPVSNAGRANYGGTSPELSLPLNKTYKVEVEATKAGSTILLDHIDVVTGYGTGVVAK